MVECNLAKVDVAGSNPVSRSKKSHPKRFADDSQRRSSAMIVVMRALAFLFVLGVSCLAAGLEEVKTVYLLPMSNGLDQYLAIRLNKSGVLRVVTDPRAADAVISDQIGETLEQRLTELYGGKKLDKDSDDAQERTFSRTGMKGMRGRGMAFLVDRKSREVLWSAYEPSRLHSPEAMDRTAGRVVSRLEKAFKSQSK